MPYKLTYFDEARLDVKEAKAWYKKQKKGLEKHFASAIKSAVQQLAKMPTANAVRYNNVRIAYPKTFCQCGCSFGAADAGVITCIS